MSKRSVLRIQNLCDFFGHRVLLLSLLALFGAAQIAQGQGTDLVVNGSFEADPLPGDPGYTGVVTGWTLGGSDLLNNASGPFYQPANGPIPEGSMVYGHQGTGATSQTITGLSNGAICTLKFYRNLRVTAPMKLTVLMGSHVLWGPTRILTTNPFVEETITFTYNSAWGNTLTFSFTDAEGDATILLDHVRLFVSYTVTPSVTGGNGTISPNTPQTVNAGSNVTFNMTPNAGYRVSQVVVDGVRIDDPVLSYTFNNVTANHTINVSFTTPDWPFSTAGYRDGWATFGDIASWTVAGDVLGYDIATTATDPMWGSQRLTLPRANYRWLRVIARNATKCTGSLMFWDDDTIGGFTGGYQHGYPINPHDTQMSEYWVDLNAHALWMAATTIEQFRFDFPDSAPAGPLGNDGTHVDVDRITLLPAASGPPAPQVTSITRFNPATAGYTNAAQVTWDVRFNHTMTTVAANDVSFTPTGTASGSIASVTAVGPTWYRVTADVSGTGTLRLNSVTGGSGRDVANQAISTGYTTGEVYSIDRNGPSVAISAPSVAITRNGPVTFTVTYTDSGSGFAASTLAPGNITLNIGGTAAGTIGVSGSGNTRTVTISSISGTGTLGISIAAGTATDTLGNTSPAAGPSATFVVDNQPPTTLCKNVTVNLSAPTIGPDAIDNGSTDNVAIASRTINGGASASYTCTNLGTNTATLRVTDTMGNFAECTATVTVVDDISPNAACKNATVNLSAPTLAAAAIDDGSTDNCAISSMLIDGAASRTFTCANLGANTVTLRVADAAGNFDECTATVTVVDDISPTAACQDITVNLSAPTIAAAAVNDGSTDNCAITSMLIDGAANRTFTCANLGANTVTLRVADAAGNFDECTATVTVVDNVLPNALCKDVTVNLSAPTLAAATIDNGSTDNCAITSMLIDGVANRTFTCANLGPNTVTLRVADAVGNFDECTATVTVVDDISPVAACKNITVNLSSPTVAASAVDDGSSDNCGITSRLINGTASRTFTCANLGANVVTLRVMDAAGNFATCASTVTVVDDIVPTAVCRNVTVNLSAPTLAAASVNNGSTDNCGVASILVDGAASRTFTCADLGPNTVTLSVSDAAGNTATCPATVTVVDDIAPVAVCKDATVYLSSPTLLPAAIDDGSSDNCTLASMLVNGAASVTFTSGDVGIQSVTLRVLDGAGLFAECTAQVTVVDDLPVEGEGEPPVEGEGEPPVEGEGEPVVEGEGEPPVEGEGEVVPEGEGEPAGLQVTADDTNIVLPIGDSVTLVTTVTGAQGTLSYQWYRIAEDDSLVVIPDANEVTYTLSDASPEDSGEYQCEVYDNVLGETAWSPRFMVLVTNGIPVAGIAGIALVSVLTAFAGMVSMRKRK